MEIHNLLAQLKNKYPEDIKQLELEQEKVRNILRKKDFQMQEATQELIQMCRKDVLLARVKLATDKSATEDPKIAQALWFIIESRMWVLNFIGKDYDEMLRNLENELKVELNSL